MLLELGIHQGQGQLGAVDRQVDLLEQVGQGADMVLVAVGDDHAFDAILILLHIGEVGQDDVHAQHFVIGERHAAVDEEGVVPVFEQGDVLADFVQAAQEGQAHRGGRGLLLPGIPAAGGLGRRRGAVGVGIGQGQHRLVRGLAAARRPFWGARRLGFLLRRGGLGCRLWRAGSAAGTPLFAGRFGSAGRGLVLVFS